jgi:hypothetical protein
MGAKNYINLKCLFKIKISDLFTKKSGTFVFAVSRTHN